MFETKIYFPPQLNYKSYAISYDSGSGEIPVSNKINNVTISDTLKSIYAVIKVNFLGKNNQIMFTDNFWVKDKGSTITYFNKTNQYRFNFPSLNPALNFKMLNALNQMQEVQSNYLKYIYREKINLNKFLKNNSEKLELNDSVTLIKYLKNKQDIEKKSYEFILNNKTSYYSFLLFKDYLMYSNYNIDSLTYLYHLFSKELINSFYGKKISIFLNAKSLKVGSDAPEFELYDLNNEKIVVNNEKITLLIFWATWCKPCMEEIPVLLQIRKKFPKENLNIIAISLDKKVETIKEAVQKNDMNWINSISNNDILDKYISKGIPEIFLIKNKKIIYTRNLEKFDDIKNLMYLNKTLNELNYKIEADSF